jgi:hypothetical protein
MEFQAKIVEGNKNPKARIVWAGAAVIFVGMVLMCIDAYQHYGFWLFGVGVVVLILGIVASRGDVDLEKLSDTELVIGMEEISVGETKYMIPLLKGIEFQVEGYDGMTDPSGYSPWGRRRYSGQSGLLNGMNNYLTFIMGDEKVETQFYLPDPQHVQQLGALFKAWYAKGIPFRECNITSNRTFLFEPVTEKEWEDRMILNGYRYNPES